MQTAFPVKFMLFRPAFRCRMCRQKTEEMRQRQGLRTSSSYGTPAGRCMSKWYSVSRSLSLQHLIYIVLEKNMFDRYRYSVHYDFGRCSQLHTQRPMDSNGSKMKLKTWPIEFPSNPPWIRVLPNRGTFMVNRVAVKVSKTLRCNEVKPPHKVHEAVSGGTLDCPCLSKTDPKHSMYGIFTYTFG